MKNHIIRKFTSVILCLTLAGTCAAMTGCSSGTASGGASGSGTASGSDSEQFEALCTEIFEEELSDDTISLHYTLANPSDYGIEHYDPTFGEYSAAEVAEDAKDCKDYAKRLAKIKRENLDEDQQITYDILNASLTESENAADYTYYMEPLQPSIGLQAEYPTLLAEYTFRTETDITDYLGLLKDLDRYYGEILTFEQEKSEAGLFMCDTLADEVIGDCTSFMEDKEDNFMISTFDERIDALDFLTDEQKASYKSENRELVLNDVMTAYQNLADGLTALKGTGVTEILTATTDGQKYYEYLLNSMVGTDKSAEDLEDMILDQMNSDLSEMQLLIQSDSSLADDYMSFSFSKTDPEEILADLQEKMLADFPELTTAVTYDVNYVPEALEDHLSPAFYLTPPVDALTENVIYINNGQTDPATLYTTLAHEGFPGHLYQTVYSSSCTQDDLIRQECQWNGFSEGWATYVEFLAYAYDTDTDADLLEFMKCNDDINLGVYALLDLYINYEGFTQDEVADWLSQIYDISDSSMISEMYYLILSQPANYLNYYVGGLEFKSLKSEAEELAGNSFDLKEFHKHILETGDCPFYLLHDYVNEWYKAK